MIFVFHELTFPEDFVKIGLTEKFSENFCFLLIRHKQTRQGMWVLTSRLIYCKLAGKQCFCKICWATYACNSVWQLIFTSDVEKHQAFRLPLDYGSDCFPRCLHSIRQWPFHRTLQIVQRQTKRHSRDQTIMSSIDFRMWN